MTQTKDGSESLRRWIRAGFGSVMALMLLASPFASLAAGAGKSGPVASKTEAAHHLIHHLNPHLHIDAGRKEVLAEAEGHWHTHWHHVWGLYNGWDFYDWATWHRGLGSVEGTVEDGGGQPLGGIAVVLRGVNGHPFHNPARRHLTHTDENGAFIMHRVRIGSYRVRAVKGKANGHVGISVSVGRAAVANIRI